MTISEIREILKKDDVPEEVLKEILSDERKGVRDLAASYMRRLERESRERMRVEALYEVESEFYKRGMTHIVGIDEVGRGPLAGPVTVAAVILTPPSLRSVRGPRRCPPCGTGQLSATASGTE